MFIEPVFGKKFFGREEVLGTLNKRVAALKGGYRQNLALAGPMLSGKSSILRHFLSNITDPDIVPLYIEMGGEDFRSFCNRFIGTMLYHFLRVRGLKPDGDIDKMKDICRGLIPDTIRNIENIFEALDQKKADSAYEMLLALTSVFKSETGKSCIVILDEFHNLSDFHLRKPFQTFGKFIMVQKNTMYIVSSSQKTLLNDILSHKLSLLFGNFEVIEVGGFDNQTAHSFVSEKVNSFASSKDVPEYLIEITQGSPFYLEVLVSRFMEISKQENNNRSEKENLLDALADVLYKSKGVLNQYFTNNINFFLEKNARKQFVPILLALANGKSTMKGIWSDLGAKDKDLSEKLQKLQDMDLAYSSGMFFKISDKLFEYWLRYVYFLKANTVVDEMDIKYLEFKRVVEEDLKKFCEFNSKDVIDTICDLFSSFKNEKVRINMNLRKLPRFEEIKARHTYGRVFDISGYVNGYSWKFHVKNGEMVNESDINKLWETKENGDGSKIAKKIIVPLKGIEQNAYLLAKEQNMWVWDLVQINKLLRLYGKYELVA